MDVVDGSSSRSPNYTSHIVRHIKSPLFELSADTDERYPGGPADISIKNALMSTTIGCTLLPLTWGCGITLGSSGEDIDSYDEKESSEHTDVAVGVFECIGESGHGPTVDRLLLLFTLWGRRVWASECNSASSHGPCFYSCFPFIFWSALHESALHNLTEVVVIHS